LGCNNAIEQAKKISATEKQSIPGFHNGKCKCKDCGRELGVE